MVVLYPFDSKFKKGEFITKCMLCSLVVPIIVTGSFTIYLFLTENKLPFSLCLPFIYPTNSLISLKVITWFLSTIQLFTSIAITIMCAYLVITLGKPKDFYISQLHSKLSKPLVIQLIIASFSNILC